MKNQGWIGWALLVLAAGIVAGCGSKGGGMSTTPALASSCPIALPASGAITLCLPPNGGVSGTLSFTVSGLPAGVTLEIEPSSAGTEPVSVRRSIAEATALQTWAMTISDDAAGANATIGGPIISLNGITNPSAPPSTSPASSVVVEMLDAIGDVAVYTLNGTSGTGAAAFANYLPTSSQDAAKLLSGCLDQATTCFIDVVDSSIFLPEPTPTFT